MPLLFSYLLQQFLNGFLRVVGVFVGLFFLADGIESIRRYSQKDNFNWGDVFLLVVSRLPDFLTILLPSITLLATLLVLTRLSRQNELTVMRASGVSLYRILIPFLMGGVIISGIHILFQDQIVPRTKLAAQKLEDSIIGSENNSGVEVGNLWLKSNQSIIHVEQLLPDEKVLLDVTVFKFDDQHHLLSRLEARVAQMYQGKWILGGGVIYRYGNIIEVETFSEQPWDITLEPKQLNRAPANPEFLSLKQLRQLAERTEREGYNATRLHVLLYRKFAHPATTLAAILLAFPFTLRYSRQGGVGRSLLLGLVTGFILFVVVDLSIALGMGGRLPPILAAWAPVLFFTGIGGFLFLHLADPKPG